MLVPGCRPALPNRPSPAHLLHQLLEALDHVQALLLRRVRGRPWEQASQRFRQRGGGGRRRRSGAGQAVNPGPWRPASTPTRPQLQRRWVQGPGGGRGEPCVPAATSAPGGRTPAGQRVWGWAGQLGGQARDCWGTSALTLPHPPPPPPARASQMRRLPWLPVAWALEEESGEGAQQAGSGYTASSAEVAGDRLENLLQSERWEPGRHVLLDHVHCTEEGGHARPASVQEGVCTRLSQQPRMRSCLRGGCAGCGAAAAAL